MVQFKATNKQKGPKDFFFFFFLEKGPKGYLLFNPIEIRVILIIPY